MKDISAPIFVLQFRGFSLRDTAFEQNVAIGGTGIRTGKGKGGAIFVVTEALTEQMGGLTFPKVISTISHCNCCNMVSLG